MNKLACTLHVVFLAIFSILCTGCGGVGTGGTGASINTGPVVAMADDAITVNGISFKTGNAQVADAFGQPAQAADLRLGMWVEVAGEFNEAGNTGTAHTIRVRPAARGVVSSVDAGGTSLTVLQTTVRYDSASVIEGADNASAIQPGDTVEIHGPLGVEAGTVVASRIEKPAAQAAAKPVELRGRVSKLDTAAQTLLVGRQLVSYASASLTLRNALANRQVVRVLAMAAPVGDQAWQVERMASDQALPENLDFVYVEGITTDWTQGPRFLIEDVPVNAAAATGRSQITGDGLRVAVIGALKAGTIEAKSVTLIKPGQSVTFELNSTIANFKSISDFRVRNISVDASAATFVDGTAAELADQRGVVVRGVMNGRRLIATRVVFKKPPT
jgi:hypothetical protein